MPGISTAFQIYVACSCVLVINLLFLANGTAYTRAKAGKFRNPEDGKLNKKAELQEDDSGHTARYRRAHLNALENILPFLPMGFLFLLTDPATWVAGLFIGGFTAFRLSHSFAYVKSIQPLRTISFAIAALLLLGMTIYTGVEVLTA